MTVDAKEWLCGMNLALLGRERQMQEQVLRDRSSGSTPPTLHVVGLPRSGTTLLAQALVAGLRPAYVDNLMARFWLAPLHGWLISRELHTGGVPSDDEFRSDYGRTGGPGGFNEFNYFWRHHLGYEGNDQRPSVPDEYWLQLRTELEAISRLAGRPFLFKSEHLLWHLPQFAHNVPFSLIVSIRRKPLDVACSLLGMRHSVGGSAKEWVSLRPAGWEHLSSSAPHEQVAWQVRTLREHLDAGMAELGPTRLLEVQYEDLCRNPRAVILQVAEWLWAATGFSVRQAIHDVPRQFEHRNHANSDIAAEFARLGLER